MYNYWVCAKSRRSKSFIKVVTNCENRFFLLLDNDDKNVEKKSTVNLLDV